MKNIKKGIMNNINEIRDGSMFSDIISIFTNESLMVEYLGKIKRYVIVYILFLIVIICTTNLIKQYILLKAVIIAVSFFVICSFIIKKSTKLQCIYLKHKGANKSFNVIYMCRNIEVIIKNNNLLKKEDFMLFKKILKVNGLDNNKSIQLLKENCSLKKKKEINIRMFFDVIVAQYLLEILFGVINIYLSLNIKNELMEKLLDISYIIHYIVLFGAIAFCFYLLYMIKRISSEQDYVINRMEEMLFEMQLKNSRSK